MKIDYLINGSLKFILAGIICVLTISAFSQPLGMNNMAPQSPEVSTFIKRGDFPISYYTGTPNVSIPLFDLKEGDFSLPLALNYNGQAIKVGELPTWVGLNWDLLPGGCITNFVVGQRDAYDYPYPTSATAYNAIFAQANPPYPLLVFNDPYSGQYGALSGWTPPIYNTVSGSSLTTGFTSNEFDNMVNGGLYQPDIYFYNFLGYSGAFYQDPFTKQIKFIKKDNHILFVVDTPTGGWKATLPNGIVIQFYIKEVSTTLNSSENNTWKITKIVLPNAQEIDFRYVDKTYNFNTLSDYYSDYFKTYADELAANVIDNTPPSIPSASASGYTGINILNYTKCLTQIESPHYVIDFINNGADKPRLSEIKIYNKANYMTVKKYKFAYDEFNHFGDEWNTSTGQQAIYSKFKLTSLTPATVENNTSETNSEPYIFEYIEDIGLPHVLSRYQDYFGYFNGEYNTNLYVDESRMLTRNEFSQIAPELLSHIQNLISSRRWVNAEHSKQGMLKKMKYPEKGYTTFDFGPHAFIYEGGHFRNELEYNTSTGSDYDPSIGGGLRINQIINYDSDGAFKSRTKFKYGPANSGVLLNPIHFWKILPQGSGVGDSHTSDFVFYHSVGLSGSNLSGYPLLPGMVGYSSVDVFESSTETDGPSEVLNGRVAYEFINDEMYENTDPGDLDYAYLTEYNSSNGFTKKVQYFNSANQLIKQTDNTYELLESENFYAMKAELVYSCSGCTEFGRNNTYKLLYYPMFSRIWKNKSISDKVFINNSLSLEQTGTTDYGSSPFYLPIKITQGSSDGGTKITTFKYPADFNTSTFLSMVGAKINSPVIEQTEYKNSLSNPLSSTYTNYISLGGNLFKPSSIDIKKGTENYETRTSFHNYDNYGNPVCISQAEGPKTCYVYSYNGQYPVAEIKNAELSAVVAALGGQSTVDSFRQTATPDVVGFFSGLRAALPDALINTYTYIPLVGISSQTDAKGMTTYYEYDSLQRLKHIKDQNGNIVKSMDYHYKQ